MPNLFIFSLISSNFRANVVCSGKHRPFSYELCHCARHFSLEKFRLVENRLKTSAVIADKKYVRAQEIAYILIYMKKYSVFRGNFLSLA